MKKIYGQIYTATARQS